MSTPPKEILQERYDDWNAALSNNGMCTACGAIETRLIEVTGIQDFSHIGESAEYPTGYGCELCS